MRKVESVELSGAYNMENVPGGANSGLELSKKAVRNSLARSGFVYLIGCLAAPVIVLIVFGSVFLINSIIEKSSISADRAFLITFAAAFILVFGGMFGLFAVVIFRRKRFLDRVFLPLGLKGSIYNLFFRRYQGTVQGRPVEIYFTRGPLVEILITTSLRTRLGISLDYPETTAFADLAGSAPLRPKSPNLQGLLFWAAEERWAGNLLLIPQTEILFRRLLLSENNFLRRYLKLRPTILELHYSGNANLFKIELAPELVRQWLSDLFDILSVAETKIPPPAFPVEMNQAEITALRWKRKDITRFLVIIFVGFPLVLMLLIALILLP